MGASTRTAEEAAVQCGCAVAQIVKSLVFEGERSYGGEIFKLREHSERLIEGGRIMDFDIPYTVEEIDQACRDVIRANNLADCYVRPIAWRGSEMMAVAAQKKGTINRA